MTTNRRDSKATREFWARINQEDRVANLRGNGKCAHTYISPNSGLYCVCTESAGHTSVHYDETAR